FRGGDGGEAGRDEQAGRLDGLDGRGHAELKRRRGWGGGRSLLAGLRLGLPRLDLGGLGGLDGFGGLRPLGLGWPWFGRSRRHVISSVRDLGVAQAYSLGGR